jgi:hypothetical protein
VYTSAIDQHASYEALLRGLGALLRDVNFDDGPVEDGKIVRELFELSACPFSNAVRHVNVLASNDDLHYALLPSAGPLALLAHSIVEQGAPHRQTVRGATFGRENVPYVPSIRNLQ